MRLGAGVHWQASGLSIAAPVVVQGCRDERLGALEQLATGDVAAEITPEHFRSRRCWALIPSASVSREASPGTRVKAPYLALSRLVYGEAPTHMDPLPNPLEVFGRQFVWQP